jgi:adenylyl-sulfate kinase
MIIWLTGLSGAGKSTLAEGVAHVLRLRGTLPMIIDGDLLRYELSRDLGFSEMDRKENIRRAGAIAKMAARSGIVSICSLISPLRHERDEVRKGCDEQGIVFLEVYVAAPLSVCESRDPKGLYRKARAGMILNFTGINSPYEPPLKPEVLIETGTISITEAVNRLTAEVDRLFSSPK